MKKIFLTLIATLLFADFLPNKTYNCENIGVSIKKDNKTLNIPNNLQTKEKLKNILGNLYYISFKIGDKNLTFHTKDLNETLIYFKDYKGLKIYVTKDTQALLILDSNHTQAALNMPIQNTTIYYQCK